MFSLVFFMSSTILYLMISETIIVFEDVGVSGGDLVVLGEGSKD